MELLVTDLTTNEVISIPVMPESITVSYTNNFQTYNVLGLGEVKFPDGVMLSSISWSSFFECEGLKDAGYVSGEWQSSNTLHDKFERIKIDGRVVRVMLTDSPINFDCYLESFEVEPKEVVGRLYYSIKFIQAKEANALLEDEVGAYDGTLEGSFKYRVHIRDQGWSDWVKCGEIAGTTGQCLRIEAIQVKSYFPGIGFEYEAYLKDVGWQGMVTGPATAGTVGESRRLEAFRVRLTGNNDYDVNYRLHVRDYGWMNWSKNWEDNGTIEYANRAEAIQIIITPKGQFQANDTFISDSDVSFLWGNEETLEAARRADYRSQNENYYKYTVKEGDCLYYIAESYFKDGSRWESIYQANRELIGDNPNIIKAGMILTIPEA